MRSGSPRRNSPPTQDGVRPASSRRRNEARLTACARAASSCSGRATSRCPRFPPLRPVEEHAFITRQDTRQRSGTNRALPSCPAVREERTFGLPHHSSHKETRALLERKSAGKKGVFVHILFTSLRPKSLMVRYTEDNKFTACRSRAGKGATFLAPLRFGITIHIPRRQAGHPANRFPRGFPPFPASVSPPRNGRTKPLLPRRSWGLLALVLPLPVRAAPFLTIGAQSEWQEAHGVRAGVPPCQSLLFMPLSPTPPDPVAPCSSVSFWPQSMPLPGSAVHSRQASASS